MLPQLLESLRRPLEVMALPWQLAGATAFGIWHGGQLVRLWPAGGPSHTPPSLTAAVRVGESTLCEVGVVGPVGSQDQARLDADAALLSHLASLEYDLTIMTGDLVASQDQQLALYELVRSTRLHLDVDQTLQHLASAATRLTNSRGGFLMLAQPEQPSRIRHCPSPLLAEDHLQDLFGMLLSSRADELLLDSEQADWLPKGIAALYLRLIPIENRSPAALGLLLSLPIESISPYLKLARAIADQAGAQIENVLLHEETVAQAKLQTEMDLARQVQTRLLPRKAPSVPGLEIWGRSLPALNVGGDFFDFIESPGRSFTFTVGDVAGKGMSAALVMAMIRTIVRNRARFLDSPKLIFDRATEDLYHDFTELSAFTTVFIANYVHERRVLRYANAGHSPVIYCPAGGSAQLLEADGPPIGVLPENLCQDFELAMGPGDLLVVATDGFSEAQNPDGEFFGYERLLEIVESVAQRPTAEIGEVLFASISDFSAGHTQDDDETLVVVKAKGS